MMKKVFVCVSMQKNAERTISFARACCSHVREDELVATITTDDDGIAMFVLKPDLQTIFRNTL